MASLRTSFVTVVAVAAMSLFAGSARAAVVLANQPTLTDLGLFSAGSYQISASGIVSLAGTAGDGAFDVGPDGVPVTPVLFPGYGYFNPNGATLDALSGNATGPGGSAFNLGALIGSFVTAPNTSDYFLIGNGSNVSLSSAGHIYALVNDTFYSNNNGSFNVTVAAVPEPATWLMMIAGFGLVGAGMRRRNATVSYA